MTATTRSASRRRTPATWVRGGGLTNLLFLAPLLVIFGLFSWWPIVKSVVMSVQDTNLVSDPVFVAGANYRAVLEDPLFWQALGNTGWFMLLALVIGFPLPLVLAVLMSEVKRGRGIYTVLAYLPVVVPPVVAVLLWKTFYSASTTGVFNTILGWVGLPAQQWLQDPGLAMPSLVLESTWANAGATVIIYLAALIGVQPELYDAAEVDGAGVWRKVWHVTIPQLRNVLFITFILQIIGTAQVFLEPFLFTQGGPSNRTLTLLYLVYRYAFENSVGGDYGKATALSLMLAAALAVLSILYFKLTGGWSTTDAVSRRERWRLRRQRLSLGEIR